MTALALAAGPAARLRYQQQESEQTLEQALAEYYAHNGARVTPPEDLPPESAALFRGHDLCHVIFGLDTTLADETLADTRAMLSCDVGLRRYVQYFSVGPQTKKIMAQIKFWPAVAAVLGAVPRILRAFYEAARTKKRWPWTPPQDHFQRTLADLRAEYAIRVI